MKRLCGEDNNVFNDLHQVFESEDSEIAESVKQKQQLLRNSGTPGVGMNVEVWSTVDVLAQFHRGLCAHSLSHSIRLVLNVITLKLIDHYYLDSCSSQTFE